jgi:hypothetical protein
MYLSCQALRVLAPGGLTAAEQREADDQVGRIVAALSQPWRCFAGRTRVLAGRRAPAGHRSAAFEK